MAAGDDGKPPPLKVVLLGPYDSGKTSLMRTLVRGPDGFDPRPTSTIGVDFMTKVKTRPNGDLVTLMVWDSAGAEKYACVSPVFLRGADAVVLTVPADVQFARAVADAQRWLTKLRQCCDKTTPCLWHSPATPLFIVITKSDTSAPERAAALAEAVTPLAHAAALAFFSTHVRVTSAKCYDGVSSLEAALVGPADCAAAVGRPGGVRLPAAGRVPPVRSHATGVDTPRKPPCTIQ